MENETPQSEFDIRFPASRHLSGVYFESIKSEFAGEGMKYYITESQRKNLTGMVDALESELISMSVGIGSVGEILAIAADNTQAGIDLKTIEGIGWFLGYVGREINEHVNLVAQTNEILALHEIVPESE